MASSILNSDDGVISGVAGIKATGGDDGVLVFQSKGTETARVNTDKQIVAAAGTASLPVLTTTGDVNTGIYFPAADNIGFATNGVIRGRWTTDGLCFGSDTAAANALDDYEEGTSSGNLISNSGTFTSATYASRYRKIGSLVLLSFEATITSVGSASLGFIVPLPFTADGTFGYSGTGRRMSDSVQFHVILSNTILAVARNTASGGTLEASSTDYRGMIVYHAV